MRDLAMFLWGVAVGILIGRIVIYAATRYCRRNQPPAGLSTSFDVRPANDAEMDGINAEIRMQYTRLPLIGRVSRDEFKQAIGDKNDAHPR